MVKKTKSKTSYKQGIAKLKREKEAALKKRNLLLDRQKEIEETRELKREIAQLKGVGTKRRVAAQVGKKLGKDVGRVGWSGLKVAGKFAKNVIEAEQRAQARDRAMAQTKPRPKTRKRASPKTKAKPRKKRK